MASIYYTATSLDGFIAHQANPLEWLFQFGELEPNTFNTFLQSIGAITMGSTTYQWIYDHDFFAEAENPQPWPYKIPAWVFSSRQLLIIADADVRFVSGDVRRFTKK